jgi:PPK2 family polyphosphate:nucleotide phosphotransferase
MDIQLLDVATTPPEDLDRDTVKDMTKELQDKIRDWQVRLYAEGKQALLVVFQGMDAAGKGGAIRETFKEVNPLGVRVYPFKKPTEEEFAHDFLWRVHKRVPQKGMISVFDRSHYEDVLIQRVHEWIDMDRVRQRYRHINNFERLLVEENNTTIVKFYLHVSEDEQLERLTERMHNPEKMWKYNARDLEERKRWPDYRKAYEDVFKFCSEAAPWHIIPTDKNWYKEYLMAKIIEEAFQGMDPQFPPIETD